MFDHLSDELATVGQGRRDECPALEAAGMLPSYSSSVSSSEGLAMELALVTLLFQSLLLQTSAELLSLFGPISPQGPWGAGSREQVTRVKNNLCSPDWSTWDICQAWMGHPEGLGRTPHHEVTRPPSPFGGCGLSFFICK